MSKPAVPRFRDRADAGRQLATVLDGRAWRRPLVFGIPRGGVAVAVEVARVLGAELSVLGVRKLTAPYQPQLTLGAVTSDGVSYVDETLAREVGAGEGYLRREKAKKAMEGRRREEDLGIRGRPELRGRTAIVVDEGVVTGSTAVAAVRSLKAAGAALVVVAVPAGPPKVLCRLRQEADQVFCVEEARDFVAVERLYRDFHRLETGELQRTLAGLAARSRPAGPGSGPARELAASFV